MSNEKIDGIKERVFKHRNSDNFYMERVSKNTIQVFKAFANEEFVGDYGMAFKYLVDKLLVEPQPYIQIYQILEDMERRLLKLEGKDGKEEIRIKTCDGKERTVPLKKKRGTENEQ
jgi:hypothetical protein